MRPFRAIQVIPTGMGAALGGYAGDATPATNLLAAACDELFTHPNAVNAATLYAARPNVLYVEGHALDRFCLGQWALRPVHANRIGLVLDAGLDAAARLALLTAMDAMRAVAGVAIAGVATTRVPVQSRIVLDARGASHGELLNPAVLVAAARTLSTAEAFAVVTRMPELPAAAEEAYLRGQGADPIGGLEAAISHYLVHELMAPCAHAPYEPPDAARPVDPRVAAEWVGTTYLPCILAGLRRAPRPVTQPRPGDWTFEQIDAVVAPLGACGGVPMLAAVAAGVPVIAVAENQVVAPVAPEALGLPVLRVASYMEAAGLLLALREGLDPASLRRPLGKLKF